MTPKEKAKELVDKFYDEQNKIEWTTNEKILKDSEKNYFKNKETIEIYWNNLAKQSALIAVDEIIKQLTPIEKAPNNKSAFLYWEEVKQKIENL
jgi:hypothetical protein